MKITRKQLRQIILEACGCGSNPEPEYIDIDNMSPQDAFALGLAVAQSRDIDPITVEDAFYPEEVEAREDAWAGGDNIEDPLNHADFETGESNAGPHVRTGGCAMREVKISRKQLRTIINEEISRLVEEEDKTDWAKVLPAGIVKYDGGKKKRSAVETIQKALKALAKLKKTSDPGTVDGRYGNKTVDSIKKFQGNVDGVKRDGDYGPQTRKAMIDLLKKAPEEKPDQAEETEEDEKPQEEKGPKFGPQIIKFNLATRLGGRKRNAKEFNNKKAKILKQATNELAKRIKSIYGRDIKSLKAEVHDEKHGRFPDPHFLITVVVASGDKDIDSKGGKEIALQAVAIITSLLKTSVDTNYKINPNVQRFKIN